MTIGPQTDPERPVRRPDAAGFAERDGVRLAWEQYGLSGAHLMLMPTWSIVRSRFWKAQVSYLAQHYQVLTFDGRGSGRSSRPEGAAAYTDAEYAADTVAVLDAAGVDSTVLVSLSCAVAWSVHLAAEHPDRVLGVFAIAPSCGLGVPQPEREKYSWDGRLTTIEGWAKYNKQYWLEGGYDDFVGWFFAQMFSEPHSTKQIEDAHRWGLELAPQTLADVTAGRLGCDGAVCTPLEPLCERVTCPITVLHGTEDRIRGHAIGERLAELTGASLILVEGGGHGLPARDPVFVNQEIRRFVDRVVQPPPARRTWVRALRRPKRALYLCSPIGLGHARRDVAIADELRLLHPDLQIDWLTQDPVTRMLADRNERLHPASALLANESAHFEDESTEHDLHAFGAVRRMDEIMINNFMVFSDLIEAEHYDLVIGDEAWDVDHFLHENPELKRSPYAWLTDFVGWLPMPDGGAAEAALTADYNGEMLAQRSRFRRLRDRSIFVGNPEDIVPDAFGPGLPQIREWTTQNFDFAGYVTGFDPDRNIDREQLRARLGYRPDERVALVTVGGSGVGVALLRRVLAAVPLIRRLLPDLRFVVVCGPRIDPEALPRPAGVTVIGYLPELQNHLTACDLAIVQGGLTTCMELTASRRPFIFVPLRNHFEQNLHVRHRLARYGAGRCLEYQDAADPERLAEAVVKEIDCSVNYLPVETDGAARAAALLADLL
ncbi:MAG TPA: alpha/beta fold hydrolase [Kineosporiaceae bacterium]|nr:alpha/beta fold hydrolase [Kineosporiaceae bacterium]